jgi:NAD(P)-dependent dehydrogenase (short-subunit alcohol dehydrogenase family)
MDLGLRGRSVLITGASRGIGRAIAASFAAEGCKLKLAARSAEGLAALKVDLVARFGIEVDTFVVDLAEAGAPQRLIDHFPHVDVLVNNAGATPRGDLLQLEEDAWRAGWELKLFGYINATRACYRQMVARGSGVIINVIGLGAEKLEYAYAAGSTGNAALVAFTRSVGSMSLDHGVRVLGVNPGWVETDKAIASLRRRSEEACGDPERWRDFLVGWPAQRLIRPEEIADVVCFLASDRASSVCGTVVSIDGGFGARAYPRAPEMPAPKAG